MNRQNWICFQRLGKAACKLIILNSVAVLLYSYLHKVYIGPYLPILHTIIGYTLCTQHVRGVVVYKDGKPLFVSVHRYCK